MTELDQELNRKDLIELRGRYEAQIKDYLNLCYQYLNFYTGLLSAIVAATIAGILEINKGEIRGLVLLIGPVITIILGKLGYSNVKVFYRRFIEAWVNLRNVEEMLGDEYDQLLRSAKREPLFESKHDGFIAKFERMEIEDIIEDAKKRGLNAEQFIEESTEKGDTLSYAKKTLLVFELVSIVLTLAIIILVLSK